MPFIKNLIVLLVVLLCVHFPAIAEIENAIPVSWDMIYETTDPIQAASTVVYNSL